jgi:hypothetical protein
MPSSSLWAIRRAVYFTLLSFTLITHSNANHPLFKLKENLQAKCPADEMDFKSGIPLLATSSIN